MKKRLAVLFLALCLSFGIISPASAYGGSKHNKLIEEILFGNDHAADSFSDSSATSLTCLEYATMISLDQFNDNYSRELKYLRDQKIHGLIKNIDEIKFKSSYRHRAKTHQGWDHDYSPNDEGKWSLRKTLLLQTVNHVFGFQKKAGTGHFPWIWKDYGYTDECNSFSAFLYYLHILGEFEEISKELKSSSVSSLQLEALTQDVIPLAKSHPSDQAPDLFWELEKHLPVIFSAQKDSGSQVYDSMMREIRNIARDARNFTKTEYAITLNNAEGYYVYAEKLICVLKKHIPRLLQHTDYFTDVFPTGTW